MTVLVLDSSAVTGLAKRTAQARAMLETLRRSDDWPARIPSVVLVECLTGEARHDSRTNQFVKTCEVVVALPQALARRAAVLRHRAGVARLSTQSWWRWPSGGGS